MQAHPPARGALRAVVGAVLAIALVTPAAAAPRRGAAAATPRAPQPSAVPLPPAPEVPLAPPPAVEQPRGTWLGASAGFWSGFDLGQSVALQIEYGVERTPPSWTRLGLEYRLSVMVARPTDETELTRVMGVAYPFQPVSVVSGAEKTEAWVVEVAPAARVRLPFQKLAVFVDVGVGIAQTVERYERDEMFEGSTTKTENVTGLVARLGGGVSYDLSPRTRLVAVPVALSFQLGPSYSAYTPSLGLSYRL